MQLRNTRDPRDVVSFSTAVIRGMGQGGGLYLPMGLPRLPDVADLLTLGFHDRATAICHALLGDEFSESELRAVVTTSFDFPLPLVNLTERLAVMELFHGPTLAFKDFGARFMARLFALLVEQRKVRVPLTILTATSGDTGAAVAHAFHGVDGVRVVVLYPAGRISTHQEALFCTLGGNVVTCALNGSFDDCQALVKAAFEDAELCQLRGLTSANSINAARLVAQILYYFEICAAWHAQGVLSGAGKMRTLVSVPSGNFGNLTAGLMAREMGAPIDTFVAATNANDTVPRYLETGIYRPQPSVATLSSAMDVGAPSNWERIMALFANDPKKLLTLVRAGSVSDGETRDAMGALLRAGYVAEPHAAVAYAALSRFVLDDECGVFLATAHPAKFREVVEETLGTALSLPEVLASALKRPLLSVPLENDGARLREILLGS